MRSSPRKFETEEELYAAALRALMRRAHSIHEMRDYLTRRADDADLVSRVVAKLRERAYLDDARYALDYARTHAQSRRQGRSALHVSSGLVGFPTGISKLPSTQSSPRPTSPA